MLFQLATLLLKFCDASVSKTQIFVSNESQLRPLHVYLLLSSNILCLIQLSTHISEWTNINEKAQFINLQNYLNSSTPIQSLCIINSYMFLLGYAESNVLSYITLRESSIKSYYDQNPALEVDESEKLTSNSVLLRFWPFSKPNLQDGTIDIKYLGNDYAIVLTGYGNIKIWNLKSRKLIHSFEKIFNYQSSFQENDDVGSIVFSNSPLRLIQRKKGLFDIIIHGKLNQDSVEKFEHFILKKEEFTNSENFDNEFSIVHKQTIFGFDINTNLKPQRLVDFLIHKDQLWTLWSRREGGEYLVRYKPLLSTSATEELSASRISQNYLGWRECRTLNYDFVLFPNGIEFEIFTPELADYTFEKLSSFPPNILYRAGLLTLENNQDFQNLSFNYIKEQISDKFELDFGSIETENYESRNTFLLLSLEKYWNQCVECWLDEYSPLGFYKIDSNSLGLLNMTCLSLIRPMDIIETLQFSQIIGKKNSLKYSFSYYLKDNIELSKISNNTSILSDIVATIDCISFISSYIRQYQLSELQSKLLFNTEPFDAAYSYLVNLTHGNSSSFTSFQTILQRKLNQIKKLNIAIHIISQILDMNPFNSLEENMHDIPKLIFNQQEDSFTVSMICKQIIESRFAFALGFSFLVQLLSLNSTSIQNLLRYQIQQGILQEASSRVKRYFTVMWSTRQGWQPRVYEMESDSFGFEKLQLTKNDSLQTTNFLSKFISLRYNEIMDHLNSINQSRSINIGYTSILSYISELVISLIFVYEDDALSQLRAIRIALTLYKNHQFNILLGYARLNIAKIPLMSHFIGLCLVLKGTEVSFKEALKYFIEASTYLQVDEFKDQSNEVMKTFQKSTDLPLDSEYLFKFNNSPIYEYFCELTQLFTKYQYLELELAKLALKYSDFVKENISTPVSKIISITFNGYLNQEKYDDAYNAIMSNLDSSYRKPDIKLFVSKLIEKKKHYLLNFYSFAGFASEVEESLTLYAQYTDILKAKKFYFLKYSFLMVRHMYNSAAYIMCEYANRISRESELLTKEYLILQKNCYARAIQALQLVKNENQWILFPNFEDELKKAAPSRSGKRPRNSNQTFSEISESLKNKVLDIQEPRLITTQDIQGLFLLTKAKIELFEQNQSKKLSISNTINTISLEAEDIYVLLVEAYIFDTAKSVCEFFDLDPKILIEKIACLCVFSETGISSQSYSFLTDEGTFVLNSGKPSKEGWILLQKYLKSYENTLKGYHYHNLAASVILKHAPYLKFPDWLLNTLEEKCSNDLLTLYLKYGQIEYSINLIYKLDKAGKMQFVNNQIQFITPRNIDRLYETVKSSLKYKSENITKILKKYVDNDQFIE